MASRQLAAAILMGAACWTGVARSDPPEGPPQSPAGTRIDVKYEAPSDPKFQPIFETLRRRKVLERLQGFLTPLRLPRPLTIRVAECGGAETVPYKPGDPATICYEFVQKLIDVTNRNTDDPKERVQVVNGMFVAAALHQVAYAVFDLLDVPVWGREDDAADRLAAFIMTEFGDQVAVSTILGTAKFFGYTQHPWAGADFAEVVSPEKQRFYNYLCMAYGADPLTFHFLSGPPVPGTKVGQIPEYRAVRCEQEFNQVRHAFDLRIMPYVDADVVTKVRAADWLAPEEVPGAVQ